MLSCLGEDIYFVFQNTPRIFSHDRVKYIDTTADNIFKSRFIDTCDAMIHARKMGETFGLAVGEFSSKNKPIITCRSYDSAHVNILKDKAILYDLNNIQQIYNIFKNFDREKMKEKDWNAYNDYLPEKVMDKFHIYIKPLLI